MSSYLNIEKLCTLSALLFEYKNELIKYGQDALRIEAEDYEYGELESNINAIDQAHRIVCEDINFRFEQ